MREIKFRYVWERPKAWAGPYRPDDDKVKIVYLSLDAITSGKSIRPTACPDYQYSLLVARNEYTGVKDKNGVDIYEEDIIQAYGDVYNKGSAKTGDPETVKYSAPGFLPFIIPCHGGELLIDDAEFEVIGNIYENPELRDNTK